MKKIINKIMRKLGYAPINKEAEILYECMTESYYRKGAVMTIDLKFGTRVKIKADSIFEL